MVYENISKLCKKKGISIAKLERELGIGNGTIGRWNKGTATVDNVKKVADYFGCTVDELLASDAPQA